MTNERNLVNVERLEETKGIVGELLQAELVAIWLSGFAETDLVREDDAVASGSEDDGGGVPGRAAEILAMEQDGGLAIANHGGSHVHVCHLEGLAVLAGELVDLDGPWVGEV